MFSEEKFFNNDKLFDNDKLLKNYFGEYKIGLLGKGRASLYIHEKHIDGLGAVYHDNRFQEYSFDILNEKIKSVSSTFINSYRCIVVEFYTGTKDSSYVYLPNLDMVEEIIEYIQKIIEDTAKQVERKKQLALEEKRKHEAECLTFFNDCYEFHISRDKNPYFELQNDTLVFSCIYVDKDKNLNFLRIDGNQQEEYNACIPYDKIHYYEKAGSVHYTTAVNGSFSSFGGTISGGEISKGASLVGGLLFGPMGMAAGAVLSHKPSKVTFPSNKFDLSSEIQKIDDRSVILNYYSDVREQYIDIALPADIFNFMQTHVPEKKYEIVCEIEKQVAMSKTNQERNINLIQGAQQPKLSMDEFKESVDKLKYMFEVGMITEEVYEAKKMELMQQI